MSHMAKVINAKLAELRRACELARQAMRDAFGRRWSGCNRQNSDKPSSWDLHWENRQAEARIQRPLDVEARERELAEFIAESRLVMGPDWIGNDHGRLCWEPYLGGMPIAHHFCQREEGHDGNHADEWPETRWACNSPRGSWPQGVTNDREWRQLAEMRMPPAAREEDGQ